MMIVLIMGSRMLFKSTSELMQSWEARSWPVASGTITRSNLQLNTQKVRRRGEDGIRRSFSEDFYTADIEYEFRVNDQVLKGTRISSVQGGNLADKAHVQQILDRYPLGQIVNVSFNPKDTAQSVLEPGTWGGFIVMAGLASFLIVVPMLVIWVAWHPKHSQLISGL